LTSCHFLLFPNLKAELEGRTFNSKGDVTENMMRELTAQARSQKYQNHWNQAIQKQEYYSLGDKF
jgi:hypothetical protein